MENNFIIHCGTFPFDILFFFGSTKQLKRHLLKYEDMKEMVEFLIDPQVARYYFARGKSIIHFPDFNGEAQHMGTMLHEILHAVFNILDYCGIEYLRGKEEGGSKCGSEEVYTYLLQHIVTHFLFEYQKNNHALHTRRTPNPPRDTPS